MTVDRQPGFQKWYSHIRSESAFLPKRLVVITTLLFAFYGVLLLRSEFSERPFGIGLVDAILKSKLSADYEQGADPSAPFAPLQLAIIEAKIRDENPDLSAEAVTVLVQNAIAAATAPIVTATPTSALYGQAVLKAAIVVSGALAMSKPVATVTPVGTRRGMLIGSASTNGMAVRLTTRLPAPPTLRDQSNGVNGVSINAVTMVPPVNTPLALSMETVAQQSPSSSFSSSPSSMGEVTFVPLPAMPNQAVEQIAPLSPVLTTTIGIAPGIVTQVLSLPDTIITTTAIAAIQATPVQTIFIDTPTPTPFVGLLTLPSATPTSWSIPTWTPTATGTPVPIHTPTATWTANPNAPVASTPTTIPSATSLPTDTPTATPIAFSPVSPVTPIAPPPIGMATTAPTLMATSLPTATASPTVSPTLSPTATPTLGAPATIANLTARVEKDKVYLAWSPSSAAGIIGYHLYRSTMTTLGVGERINPALLSAPSYVDTVALDGSHYGYVATAVNQGNMESLPGTAVTIVVADQVAPRTPTQFSASLNGSQIQLRWQANEEADLAGYNVYHSNRLPIDHTKGPINGNTLLAAPSYMDTIVLDGQTYYYNFTAVDRAGNESSLSLEIQMPTIDLVAPAVPTGLKITLQGTTALIQWQANSEADIIGYHLYRSAAIPVDLTLAPLHSEPVLTSLHYEDHTIEPGHLYYYVLVAVDMSQNRSAPSAAVALP